MFMSNLQKRLAAARREEGFTLIELLVVLIIIGVLLAIAVPSYLGFKDRAESRAAGSNVRAAIPAVEAYYSDDPAQNNGVGGNSSYAGLSVPNLQTIDAGVSLTTAEPRSVGTGTNNSYCVSSQVGNFWGFKMGPDGQVSVTAKGAPNPCA